MRALQYILAAGIIPVAAGLDFQPNLGQAAKPVRYVASGAGPAISIGDAFLGELRFLGVRDGEWLSESRTNHTIRYCTSQLINKAACRQGVPSFQRITRRNLYDGIDWLVYGSGERLEYDLILSPGANPSQIRISVPGGRLVDGELHTDEFIQRRPVGYQVDNGKRRLVRVELTETAPATFGFIVGDYDPGLPLVIDPIVDHANAIEAPAAVTGMSGSFRFGTVRSERGDKDIFVHHDAGFGSSTIYWGGEGDEEIGGSAANGTALSLAGWTASRSLPGYNGGATDGFVLRLSSQGELSEAILVGGPGEDRVYNAVETGAALYIAGASDNSAWPHARITRRGPGGKLDAFVGLWHGGAPELVFIGGSGDDNVRRIVADGQQSVHVAGETDSPEFEELGGGAGGIWTGRLTIERFGWASGRRLDGFAAGDRVTGLALVGEFGLYVAGTTASQGIELASNRYHGGASDGFLARIRVPDGPPVAIRYVGGEGRDEIDFLAVRNNTIYLGGATDSKEIPLRGMPSGDASLGGTDGLLALFDHRLAPVWSYRAGGSGDDRIFAVTPIATGELSIHGTGERVNARVRFGDTEWPVPEVVIGAGLQIPIAAQRTIDDDDRITLLESGDPSRVVISTERLQLGGAKASGFSRPDPSASVFYLQAVASEPGGEVAIAISGRDASSALRRLYVRVAQAYYFLSPPGPIVIRPGDTAGIAVTTAPYLADGLTMGWTQASIPGRALEPAFEFSDPTGVALVRGTRLEEREPGKYQGTVLLSRAGSYTVTLAAKGLPVAEGQRLVVASTAPPDPLTRLQLTQYFQMPVTLPFLTTPGDFLNFSCASPCAVQFRIGFGAPVNEMRLVAMPQQQLFVYANAADGDGRVTMQGVVGGQPYERQFHFRVVPPGVTAHADFRTKIGVGSILYWRYEIVPSVSREALLEGFRAEGQGFGERAAQAPSGFASGDRNLLDITVIPEGRATLHQIMGKAPGTTVVELGGLRRKIEVVPAGIRWTRETQYVQAGGFADLQYENFLTPTAAKQVRFRLADSAQFTLQTRLGQVGDAVLDLTEPYGVSVISRGAAGGRTTVFVSAAGQAEIGIPVVAVGVRLRAPQEAAMVTLRRSNSATLEGYATLRFRAELDTPSGPLIATGSSEPVQVSVEPPGICNIPSGTVPFSTLASLMVRCTAAGTVTIRATPQGRPTLTGIIHAVVAPGMLAKRPLEDTIIRVGNGLQTMVGLHNGLERFEGTITSGDPARVRLSVRPEIGGGERVEAVAGTNGIYVQGFGSEGIVNLKAVTAKGEAWEIPVYLYASTFAIRGREGPSAVATFDLLQQRASVFVVPAIVEPAAGAVLSVSQQFSVRGGTDPFFLRLENKNPAVVSLAAESILIQEGMISTTLDLSLRGAGSTEIRAAATAFSIDAAGAGLSVRVPSNSLAFDREVVLSPGMQMAVSIRSYDPSMNAVVRSLDPEKLLIAGSADGPARESWPVNEASQRLIYLRTGAGARVGEKIGVEIVAPPFATTRIEGEVHEAEVAILRNESELRVSPNQLNLFIPVAVRPRSSLFAGGPNPGSGWRVEMRSSDPSIVDVVEPSLAVGPEGFASFQLRPVRPGKATLRISGPEGIVNRTPEAAIEITPWLIGPFSAGSSARYLSAPVQVANPRNIAIDVTVRSTGRSATWLGRSAAGVDGPQNGSVTLRVPANGQATFYHEPVGEDRDVELTFSSFEFEDRKLNLTAYTPTIRVEPAAITANLANGTSSTTVALAILENLIRGAVLGNSLGGLRVAVRSSNPQVFRPVADTVVFRPGEVQQSLGLQLVGRGEGFLMVDMPPGFGGSARQIQILVQVR